MTRADRAVVLMAFANPVGDLSGIQKEIGVVKDTFYAVDDLIELQIDQRVELDGIRKSFQRARDRIVLFHFAGHAESTSLLFETASGQTERMDASTFARFLSTQENLDVVFLNGCTTLKQCDALIDSGVRCVVATTEKISDTAAVTFANAFYGALTTNATIEDSFTEAATATEFQHSGNRRTMYIDIDADPDETAEASDTQESPWIIRYADDSARQWNLMKLARGIHARATISPEEKRQHDQLRLLLDRVKSFWVGGVLSRAVGDGLLHLSTEVRPDAINQPWEGLKIARGEQPEALGATDRISDVFASVDRRLLILGQPGSGKTTTLLELTNQLILDADKNIADGVPVVFHLSSFTNPDQPFDAWLECELLDKYQIPRKIGSQWIEQERLILLLDGLDEVLPNFRVACVHAIHAFLAERIQQSICVCSRVKEYEELNIKLELSGAICLQPLTKEQILRYVEDGGEEFGTLREILNQHEPLLELAQSPLMLNIMSQAYSETDANAIRREHEGDEAGYRKHLFDTYVDKMFAGPVAKDPPFPRRDTLRWLSWLARKIDTESGSAIVHLESLQPNWLTRLGQQATYAAGISAAMALMSTVFTSSLWLGAGAISPDTLKGFIGPVASQKWSSPDTNGSMLTIAGHALTGGYALRALLIFFVWFNAVAVAERYMPDWNQRRDSKLSSSIIQGFVKALVFLLMWIPLAWLFATESGNEATGNDLFDILMFTGIAASSMLGFYGASSKCIEEIRPVETVGFSLSGAGRGAMIGSGMGFCFWLFARLSWSREPNLVFWFRAKDDIEVLKGEYNGMPIETFVPCDGFVIFLIAFVMIGVVLGAVFGARVPKVIESKSEPNQGIRLSIHNAIRSAVIASVSIALIVLACILVQNLEAKGLLADRGPLTLTMAFSTALGSAMSGGFVAMMWFGGFAVLKHYWLRTLLRLFGYLPSNLTTLLEHAASLDFMTRVGGGYLFNHRLLLDHFAAMPLDTQED